MATILLGKQIPLNMVSTNTFILKGIRPSVGYDKNGNPTSEQNGYMLSVVEIDNFKTLKVKIPMVTLKVTSEQIEQARNESKHIFISLDEAFIKPYFSSATKTVEDSIIAKNFSVVQAKL